MSAGSRRQAIRRLGGRRGMGEPMDLPAGWLDGYSAVLTQSEVAAIFGVDSKTVGRWERKGRIRAFRTPGGHRRYLLDEVKRLVTTGWEEDGNGQAGARAGNGEGLADEPSDR